MANAPSTSKLPRRLARRFIITGCGIALLIGATWIWWCNSSLRMVLHGKEAHMKLVGVSKGLHEYWESRGHLPNLAEWKDAVVENSVIEPGQPVFNSRDRLKNCFPVTGPESPWTLNGSFAECRKRGDLLLAICDPQSRFSTDSCATASLEAGYNLTLFDATGNKLGTLGPETTIQSLYISGVVTQQKVAELGAPANKSRFPTRPSESKMSSMESADDRICECGKPARWANDPHFPVEFDAELNEYHMVRDGAKALMRYCSWCGGRLPESKRRTFFTTPDPVEMADVESLLKGVHSHEEVVRVLGPPDEIRELGGLDKDTATHAVIARWDKHYRYTKRWKSLVLYVPVIIEGRFSYMIHGRDLGRKRPQTQ